MIDYTRDLSSLLKGLQAVDPPVYLLFPGGFEVCLRCGCHYSVHSRGVAGPCFGAWGEYPRFSACPKECLGYVWRGAPDDPENYEPDDGSYPLQREELMEMELDW